MEDWERTAGVSAAPSAMAATGVAERIIAPVASAQSALRIPREVYHLPPRVRLAEHVPTVMVVPPPQTGPRNRRARPKACIVMGWSFSEIMALNLSQSGKRSISSVYEYVTRNWIQPENTSGAGRRRHGMPLRRRAAPQKTTPPIRRGRCYSMGSLLPFPRSPRMTCSGLCPS